jgi:hypothetical protein
MHLHSLFIRLLKQTLIKAFSALEIIVATIAPTALRFSVFNLVIYKSETAVGWYEGEVVKVSQRMRFSESHSEYIAYLVWPHRDDLSDDEMGTEWVREDTDAYVRPRPVNLIPDPAKFKPLLSCPMIHIIFCTLIKSFMTQKVRRVGGRDA